MWETVDCETLKVVHIGVLSSRSSLDALSFLKKYYRSGAVDRWYGPIAARGKIGQWNCLGVITNEYDTHENRNVVERVFREIKRRTICLSTFSPDPADD